MGYPLRRYLPGVTYEITVRTQQGRFLLRPSEPVRDAILGVIGRAQALYPSVHLHSFIYLSNHFHMLATCGDGEEFAQFLQYINSNVAKRVGALHQWEGKFWKIHSEVIPVLDDEAVIDRFKYVLRNCVKEGLVASPRDWPGATSVHGLLGNMEIPTTWIDLDERRRDRARKIKRHRSEYQYTIVLSPLPVWADLSADELRAKHEALVAEVEAEAKPHPLGVATILALDPHARPQNTLVRTRPPICHTKQRQTYDAYRNSCADYEAKFRSVANTFHRNGAVAIEWFPPGSFPRPRWFRRFEHDWHPRADVLPLWHPGSN